MEDYANSIEFMVQSTTYICDLFKSGRKSPFFMNAGAYVTGEQLRWAFIYARAIFDDNFYSILDVVFVPSLSVITAMGINELYGKQVQYCSNRKEAKITALTLACFLGAELKDGQRVVRLKTSPLPAVY